MVIASSRAGLSWNTNPPPWMMKFATLRWKIELAYAPESMYARKLATVCGVCWSNNSTSIVPADEGELDHAIHIHIAEYAGMLMIVSWGRP